jgi:hypothetical protein
LQTDRTRGDRTTRALGDQARHNEPSHFLGNSQNAVKTQVWCAVATCVLIAIVKKQLHLDASLYTRLPILSVNIFEKMPLQQALTENAHPQAQQSGSDGDENDENRPPAHYVPPSDPFSRSTDCGIYDGAVPILTVA